MDWVVQNKDAYGIRVLNLSFSAGVVSHYWDDPLNQAVMAAWRAGIVVVTSAGNAGPDPMTVGVPGNVPYVISVGALSDSSTPSNPDDDTLASFSAAGPTVEGFVKPDVLAPGGHVKALMRKQDYIPRFSCPMQVLELRATPQVECGTGFYVRSMRWFATGVSHRHKYRPLGVDSGVGKDIR